MPHPFAQYHFDGQASDEHALLILHRHWFDFLSQFFIIFLMLSLLFGSYMLNAYFFYHGNNPLYNHLLDFSQSLFFIFAWIAFFILWVDYYFDVWIVTDKRLVNIEQKGLFSQENSELPLEKIQDVLPDVKGTFPTFFNYGQLEVQTAGGREKFIFRDIPDPYGVKALILNMRKK